MDLAADEEGEIPNDAELIQKLCYLDDKPDIVRFIEIGLIDKPKGYTTMAAQRRQSDASVTHQKQRRVKEYKSREESARDPTQTKLELPKSWGQWAVDQGHTVKGSTRKPINSKITSSLHQVRKASNSTGSHVAKLDPKR